MALPILTSSAATSSVCPHPAGESYTAKLDGKSYPAKGRYQSDSVSLKRIDERTIEETDMLDGELVFVVTLTLIPDGKTMTVVETSK